MADTMQAVIETERLGGARELPLIDGRKTLLIGLGSTGAKVCNQVLERLTWTYGSPENVPWVRALVLETQLPPAERSLNKHARFIHLKIDREQYSGLINHPGNWASTLDFTSWNIPSVAATTDQLIDGANNTRLLGRLALLFGSNFTKVMEAIEAEYGSLLTLKDGEAASAFKRAVREDVRIRFPNAVYVYVVGTLCGGTASGCFIDIGYMLERFAQTGNPFETTGIFLLPAQGDTTKLEVANAYAALLELNHFSSDRTRYRAQFPDMPGVPWLAPTAGRRPYHNLYLVQSRNGTKENEYAKLLTVTADYIYSDVVGSSAVIRDGERTNIKQFFVQRDYAGATQKYFTFGLSCIEFPYAKVAKACTVRLAQRGFQELAGGKPLTDMQRADLLNQVDFLNRDKLVRRLLQREGAPLDQMMRQVLADAAPHAKLTDDALAVVQEQIQNAFDGQAQAAHPQLPERIVPRTIGENALSAEENLQRSIEATVRKMLGPQSEGLQTVASLLEALETSLGESLKASKDTSESELLQEYLGAVNASRDHVAECRKDFWLGAVFLKSQALRRYIGDFIRAANLYVEVRLQLACAPKCAEIYERTLRYVQALRSRMSNTECGLQAEVNSIVQKLDDLYRRTNVSSGAAVDGWSRTINGKELFDPNHTVDEEYTRSIRKTREQRGLTGNENEIERTLGLEVVQVYVNKALAALFISPDYTGRFDRDDRKKVHDYTDADLLDLAEPGRTAFELLQSRSVLDRLLERPDCDIILTEAAKEAGLFLAWVEGHWRYDPNSKKRYGFVFFNEGDKRAEDFRQRLQNTQLLDGRKTQHIADRYQVLILGEQGAFSLGTVRMLDDDQPSAWRDYYQNPGVPSLRSRGDISAWVSWAKADEDTSRAIRDAFLVGVALDIIEFQGVQHYRFRYPQRTPADRGYIELTNDVDDATQALKTNGLQGVLETKINDFRRTYKDMEVTQRIIHLIRGDIKPGTDDEPMGCDNKFREGGQGLSTKTIEAYLLGYIFNDIALRAEYDKTKYKNTVITDYLGRGGQDPKAYYCPHCNTKLGYRPDDLFIWEERDGRRDLVARCAVCQRIIQT